MQILRYCPKCGNIDVGTNKSCIFCGQETFDTKYTMDDFIKEDLSVLKQKILEEYAKNSPKFDEELARKREREEHKTTHSSITNEEKMVLQNMGVIPKPDTNIPKCPTCGSTNIKRITTLNRVVSVGTLGLFSGKIGKNYECLDCKAKW